MRLKPHQRWFVFGAFFELALVVVAALLARLVRQPLWADLRWNLGDAILGCGAAVPPLVLFWWLLQSRKYLTNTREFLERAVGPFFAEWSILQLGIISALAGLCEEILFRGVIQGKLSSLIGPALSLTLASLLFGCVHCVSLEYVFLAASIGAYLGGIWMSTGNLLVPIVAHATYDFVALLYFLRIYHRSPPDSAVR